MFVIGKEHCIYHGKRVLYLLWEKNTTINMSCENDIVSLMWKWHFLSLVNDTMFILRYVEPLAWGNGTLSVVENGTLCHGEMALPVIGK